MGTKNLNRRLDKLKQKTHVFFSAKDLALISEYLKTPIDELRPEPMGSFDFTFMFTSLSAKKPREKDPSEEARFNKFIKSSTKADLALLHTAIENERRKHPNGAWFPKNQVQNWVEILQWAKDFFERKADIAKAKEESSERLNSGFKRFKF